MTSDGNVNGNLPTLEDDACMSLFKVLKNENVVTLNSHNVHPFPTPSFLPQLS